MFLSFQESFCFAHLAEKKNPLLIMLWDAVNVYIMLCRAYLRDTSFQFGVIQAFYKKAASVSWSKLQELANLPRPKELS